MTVPAADAAAHQLLGRIVYFHALLIEDALPGQEPAETGSTCCAHAAGCNLSAWPFMPWAVLRDVAVTMTSWYRPCPAGGQGCCAACAAATAAAAIGAGWADAECRTYRETSDPALARACGTAAAARIGTALAAVLPHETCLVLPARAAEASRPAPVTADDLPVTGELLALWAPGAAGPRPVVNWLNHCTSLADARKVLLARRNGC